MVGLGARAKRRILDLDKIADMYVGSELRPRSKSRKWSDPRTFADDGAFKMAEGEDLGALLHASRPGRRRHSAR